MPDDIVDHVDQMIARVDGVPRRGDVEVRPGPRASHAGGTRAARPLPPVGPRAHVLVRRHVGGSKSERGHCSLAGVDEREGPAEEVAEMAPVVERVVATAFVVTAGVLALPTLSADLVIVDATLAVEDERHATGEDAADDHTDQYPECFTPVNHCGRRLAPVATRMRSRSAPPAIRVPGISYASKGRSHCRDGAPDTALRAKGRIKVGLTSLAVFESQKAEAISFIRLTPIMAC